MNVSSPVGDFPYRPERLALERGRLVVHGRMGAWPARVEVGPRDALELARLARTPLALAGVAVALLAVRSRRRRAGRLTSARVGK